MVWDSIKIINSSDENVSKFVFTGNGAVAEAVLYKYPTYQERTVICCSTQSGCPIGCRFCGAGDYFVRSLNGNEIVEQVAKCLDLVRLTEGTMPNEIDNMQIMFMSMGEPMLNVKNLLPAIRSLNYLYPKAKLLVSTSAPKTLNSFVQLFQVAKEVDTVGLQFSVHESTNEARDKLIPFEHKCSLEEIATLGEQFLQETGRKPFFNYCVHENNNSAEDVARLRQLFDPTIWEATISVICERNEHVSAANERQRDLASRFQQLMMAAGFSTRMFDPAGQDDIGGGCGQLWFVQDWMKDHPEYARPSIGNGQPVVHTPA